MWIILTDPSQESKGQRSLLRSRSAESLPQAWGSSALYSYEFALVPAAAREEQAPFVTAFFVAP